LILWRVVWPTITNKLVLQGLKNEGIASACLILVSDTHAESNHVIWTSVLQTAPKEVVNLLMWCQVSQKWWM